MAAKKKIKGEIVGVIDAYGAVHSEFTGLELKNHTTYWTVKHSRWRWSHSQGIYILQPDSFTSEDWEKIKNHLYKKYGITDSN